MDGINIIDTITNVGVPVACMVALYVQNQKITDKLIKLTEDVTGTVKDFASKMDDLTDAIRKG